MTDGLEDMHSYIEGDNGTVRKIRPEQREALKALEWINYIVETESGAEADSALETIHTYILSSTPGGPGAALTYAAQRCPEPVAFKE